MSKHWRPDEDIVHARFGDGRRLRSLDEFVPPEFVGRMERVRKAHRSLPHGSRTGLVLLAAACIGVAVGLHEAFGPRDVFERDVAGDWSAVDEAQKR